MIKRWVYVALAFGLGMSAMSCENQKFNDVKVDVDRGFQVKVTYT